MPRATHGGSSDRTLGKTPARQQCSTRTDHPDSELSILGSLEDSGRQAMADLVLLLIPFGGRVGMAGSDCLFMLILQFSSPLHFRGTGTTLVWRGYHRVSPFSNTYFHKGRTLQLASLLTRLELYSHKISSRTYLLFSNATQLQGGNAS